MFCKQNKWIYVRPRVRSHSLFFFFFDKLKLTKVAFPTKAPFFLLKECPFCWTNILLFSYRKLNNPPPIVHLSATQMKLADLCKCSYTIRLGARFSFLISHSKICKIFFFFAGLGQNSFAVPLRWVDRFLFFLTSFTSVYGNIFGKCPTLYEWTIKKLPMP